MFVYYIYLLFFLNNETKTRPESLHQEENVCGPNKHTGEECTLEFPPAKVNDQDCEPNAFILIDCNVCRCGLDGEIDKTRCTKYKCNNNQTKTRRVYDRCKLGHWYQSSRCNLCYCVNKHKLICNSNKTRDKVRLGGYDLSDCGEKLVKNLSKLVPIERWLRSVTNKAHFDTKKSFLKSNVVTKSSSVEQATTPKVVSLSPDIEIKFGNVNGRNKASIEADTKSRGFMDLFDNGKDNDISYFNINSIELNPDSNTDTKADRNSLYDLDYITSKEANVENMNDDAPKSNLDLSNVLDTILSLAVRKSMVSIGSGNHCEPGSTVKRGCNTCFCLANGKSLCSAKICE